MRKIACALATVVVACVNIMAVETSMFGPNVHIYGPEDDPAAISAELDSIHAVMRYKHFSNERHAVYFLPGDYTKVGTISIPYYMTVAGLGETPYDVCIGNIDTPTPVKDSKNALITFWRSIENFYVVKTDTSKMCWGVSQAAPMRRIVSERLVTLDLGGYASGGYNADCIFLDEVATRNQQQWYMRNSILGRGLEPMSHSGWNYGFQGVELQDTTRVSQLRDSWTNDSLHCNITLIDSTPAIKEKPFLYINKKGEYKVFVPSLIRNYKGVSFSKESIGEGKSLNLKKSFFIAKPGDSAETINKELKHGKNIFFTPGVYELETPIVITRNGAVVMGTGMATLVPGKGNNEAALIIDQKAKDVVVSSLMFDALYCSRTFITVGTGKDNNVNADAPIVLSDIFCRVGGLVDTDVSVDVMVEINRNGVIGDHFWLWRADHGAGVSWYKNRCKNGLVVNGSDVTIYGLFNEHAQEYQTIWNGENGTCYFYQSETPYEMQSQDEYMSHSGTVKGYASYKVADNVKHHYATMMGVYDVFIRTAGNTIESHCSVEVPDTDGVKIKHLCNFGLSQNGSGFRYIINDSVSSTLGNRILRWYIDEYGK